jgi:hypothetical protein
MELSVSQNLGSVKQALLILSPSRLNLTPLGVKMVLRYHL